MIALEPHADGTVLPVRAQAGARRNGVRGEHDCQLRVCVTQSPEKGKANRAIIDVLSGALGLRKSQIELISGVTSQQKRFLMRGVSIEDSAARLAKVLGGET